MAEINKAEEEPVPEEEKPVSEPEELVLAEEEPTQEEKKEEEELSSVEEKPTTEEKEFDYEEAREEIKERLDKLEKTIIEFKKAEEELYEELDIRDRYDEEEFRRGMAYERRENGKMELSAEEIALSSLGQKGLDIYYEMHNIYDEFEKMEGKLTEGDLGKMEERLQKLQSAKEFGFNLR